MNQVIKGNRTMTFSNVKVTFLDCPFGILFSNRLTKIAFMNPDEISLTSQVKITKITIDIQDQPLNVHFSLCQVKLFVLFVNLHIEQGRCTFYL